MPKPGEPDDTPPPSFPPPEDYDPFEEEDY